MRWKVDWTGFYSLSDKDKMELIKQDETDLSHHALLGYTVVFMLLIGISLFVVMRTG